MKTIVIHDCPGFEAWRQEARSCLSQNIRPQQTKWLERTSGEHDLFEGVDDLCPAYENAPLLRVPRLFVDEAAFAACHRAPERYELLYRILWRMTHERQNLMHLRTDPDILKLQSLTKAVRRDSYKTKAFLRFREVDGHFIAWYEPEHYTLELSLPFFQNRFRNMTWSILTPYRAAHWNGQTLALSDNPNPNDAPRDDDVEKYWLTYYAATFNPARVKSQTMHRQMPKKYWKNMPETALIPNMLRTSETRARNMIDRSRQTHAVEVIDQQAKNTDARAEIM